MLAVTRSFCLDGTEAFPVEVEVDVSGGLPGFDIVGLPDTAVKEAKERVRTAIKNSGFQFPSRRITVNLAPADIKKEGPGLDLPIAAGILAGTGQVPIQQVTGKTLIGELSLEGKVREVPGILAMSLKYSKMAGSDEQFIVANGNAVEAALISGIKVYPVDNLAQLISFIVGEETIEPVVIDPFELLRNSKADSQVDMSDIKGQFTAKRALEVAASGGHNLLLIGSPGSGKTMLAKRLPTILPDLCLEEALEVTRIYSVAGLISREQPLVIERPFRAPHHTASAASLIGGGRIPRPGEISLANHGILFLDEFPEYHRDVLEALRQPLEDRVVTVSRVNASYTYPANFMLVAAMNPCPCGYYGDPEKECTCTPYQIQKYRNRLSGPLLDRIDLQIEAPRLTFADLERTKNSETSAMIKLRVEKARAKQLQRFNNTGIFYNAQIPGNLVETFCPVTGKAQKLLRQAFTHLGLSMRAYDRILKIARTIADLDDANFITEKHLAEAIQYRSWDRDQI